MNVIDNTVFSIQAQLIREMQMSEGKEPCYATPVTAKCTKNTREQCAWRYDCLNESGEKDEHSAS